MADLRLGATVDGAPLSIDSSDLTTHGVIVGMTGSGKTGLGVVLLEEALLNGIPALILDPKGDMGNLALPVPEDDPAWVAGAGPEGVERARALRAAASVTIYTPGSSAGVPMNLIGSLRAPALSFETEAEALRDEIEGTVMGLLGLIGIDADPLASREYVLLANLVETAWRAGADLDLATLIGQVQTPPLRKLGVFDVDAFFPPKDRMALALRLNGLAASPSFAAWNQGPPFDPGALLAGGPRAAVVYLAHLSDSERQFVVALILSKLVTWMRGQPGTSDLRALVYMDEVFGFAPPTAAPPAKKPILTILKQARAFGVGMVLATQNPVDLDYKAMANAGTWMVGRLQTDNDKARVLAGLKSAAGGTDLAALDAAIGGLPKRGFMLVSAKADAPTVFTTRWALSPLRGPLTREQIAALKPAAAVAPPAGEPTPTATTPPAGDATPAAPPPRADGAMPAATMPAVGHATPAAPPPPADDTTPAATMPAAPPPPADDTTPVAPPVAPGVAVAYLDPAAPWATQLRGERLCAYLAARVGVRFDDAKAQVDEHTEYEALYGPLDEGFDAADALVVDFDDRDFVPVAPAAALYALPAVPIAQAAFFRDAERAIRARLAATRTLELQRNPKLKLVARPGESPEAFRARCDAAAQDRADAETAKIRARLEARQDRLEAALRQAQRRVEELTLDERTRQANELAAGAGAVLGALLGGRRRTRSIAGAISGAASRRGQVTRTAARRRTAEAKVTDVQDDLRELEQEILDEVAEIDARWREVAGAIDAVAIRPEAADVAIERLTLVWA